MATAHARNVSDLADISDYDVTGTTLKMGESDKTSFLGRVLEHNRNSLIWALVSKIANIGLESERLEQSQLRVNKTEDKKLARSIQSLLNNDDE